ncbi:FAD-binding protein [Paenarthrobacter sp. DKR-5]|uniref:FAD-binding protein n=1 Tax=Paenarthrobacter sp. DKR-5 TaxID=2835535 RepID=UPI0027DD6B48|nr:FAD-binding protein [Paenarthrobacter sp. DKR-5]
MSSASSAATVTESTTTVVIGSGLPGLAVASELSRRGVASIVVDGATVFGDGAQRRNALTDAASLTERSEILRLLRHYAASHQLDVRGATRAVDISLTRQGGAAGPKWVICTPDGLLLADNIVLTCGAHNQLRRFLAGLGIAAGKDFLHAVRSLGIYLVGVGELIAPTTRGILRQAKVVSEAISTGAVLRQELPALV